MARAPNLRAAACAGLAALAVLSAPPGALAQTYGAAPLVVDLSDDAPERAPGVHPAAGSLEAGLWAEADKAEKAARTSGERDGDPALEAYVSGVVSKVAGPFAGDVRTYVMDRPFFNASMAPNGYTEVWTGLLLRCRTEDQLAFVVGHESGHFRHSHSLENFRRLKTSQNTALAASAVIAVVSLGAMANAPTYQSIRDIADMSRSLIDITYLSTMASLMRYSREREADADSYGLTYAAAAGYFTGGDADLWRNLIDENKASDFEKVRRRAARSSIFDDHPLETDRIAAMQAQDRRMNHGQPSTRSEADEKAARRAYRDRIRPYLGAWLKDDLRRQDYGQTLYILNQLGQDGLDPGLLGFYTGEAYRLRDGAGADGVSDRDNAIRAYKAALTQPDAPADAWRALGDMYRRTGDVKDAVAAFTSYLAKAPGAADAWMVRDERDALIRDAAAAPSTGGTS